MVLVCILFCGGDGGGGVSIRCGVNVGCIRFIIGYIGRGLSLFDTVVDVLKVIVVAVMLGACVL